jgi:cobalt-zinc-cadmium efflux system membrane fusion protein
LSLAVLLGLAWWGHNHNWTIPSFSGRAEEEKKSDEDPSKEGGEASSAKSPDGLPTRIDLRSADVVRKAGIQTAPAAARNLSRYVTAHATLDYEPGRFTQLASPVDGRIWRLEKGYGASVRAGDVLAIIDSAEVGKAKADFLLSLARLDVATIQMDAVRKARASVSESDFRKAEAALSDARVRVFNDHQRLLNLGMLARLEDVVRLSDEQRARHLRLLGLPESIRIRMTTALPLLAVSTAGSIACPLSQGPWLTAAGLYPREPSDDVETLTANLFPLTAPFAGQVVRHPRAARGEVVSASRSQPLFVIADTRHLHIELEVNQDDVPLLRLGQEVTFVPQTRGSLPARGLLAHISPEVNEKTRHVLAHAEVENPDGLLRPNTFGTGRILVQKPQVVAVPSLAVQVVPASGDQKSDRYVVFIRISDKSFEVRAVQPGIQDGQFTEVAGVRPGEQVVTTGAHALKSELLKDRIGADE